MAKKKGKSKAKDKSEPKEKPKAEIETQLKEAAAVYTAVSSEPAKKTKSASKVKSKPKMQPRGTGAALWNVFVSMSEDDQAAFTQKLLHEPQWLEDISDSIAMMRAGKEPGHSFEEFEAELDAKRA